MTSPGLPPLRVLLLFGSLRSGSLARALTRVAADELSKMGAEPVVFEPAALPVYGSVTQHTAADQLAEACAWAEAFVWCTPEVHGSLSAVLKNQIDWIPESVDGKPTTKDKTLALLQVTGGAQSLNGLNAMRLIGRHLHLLTIPAQLCVANAHLEFDQAGQLTATSTRDRLQRILADLQKVTLALRT